VQPLLTVALFTIFLAEQLAGADPTRFEIASVKRVDRCKMENSMDPGRVSLEGDPLKLVISEAFNVKMDQIVGPAWLDTDCFEIIAKIPQGVGRDQLPAMFQALLTERFKFAAHKESRLRSGYELVVDKNGPKLNVSSPNMGPNAGQVRFGAAPGLSSIKGSMTIASLAHHLSTRLNGPVHDLTGLTGKYDINLSWVPDRTLEPMGRFAENSLTQAGSVDAGGAGQSTVAGPSIFTSIRDSLGLQLNPHKEPVEIVVVDHVERIPTQN